MATYCISPNETSPISPIRAHGLFLLLSGAYFLSIFLRTSAAVVMPAEAERLRGDEERAEKVYEGVTPLVAEDIAEVVGFVASRPSHVDLDLIVVRPRDQVSGASGSRFYRTP